MPGLGRLFAAKTAAAKKKRALAKAKFIRSAVKKIMVAAAISQAKAKQRTRARIKQLVVGSRLR